MVPISTPPPHREGPRHARHHHHRAGAGRATPSLDARLVWTGPDDRGIELEIVSLDLAEAIVVIHVMPTELGR